jgi:hypothetical protein
MVENVGIGAASKDGSHLVIRDSSIHSARIAGLLAYIKKQEYEGASIVAETVSFGADTVKARAQANSVITIDGENVPSEEMDIDQLYRTIISSGLKQ